ncbi:MAG: succinylglutamate desuccinylase/aspartoacylase family protein [Candidatus Adlerbacteria bacterium]|nr:succinylglutamate desuccinylase/aspartoacylase family protein [Candidatus Adlerbacteria bacterium]
MIQTYTYTSLNKGPHVLFFGAIHGNEVCGPRALAQVMKELDSGKLQLQKGSATFVPVCNPAAYAQNLRLTEENLNRIFKPTKTPRSYEAQMANVLCNLVDQCDVLLDIHSTTAKGEPFMYLDFPTKTNRAWAEVLGPTGAVVGWPELYKKFGKSHTSFDTTTYAHSRGKDTLLVECGQHKAASATGVAYNAVRNTLAHYALVAEQTHNYKPALAKITNGFFRNEGEALANPTWKHMDRVKKGAALINTKNKPVVAPHDGYIIMPKFDAAVGQDWLYFGRDL